jgi:hypothetical protein
MNEEVCVDDIAKLLEVSRKSAIQRMARLVKRHQAVRLSMPTVGNPARFRLLVSKQSLLHTQKFAGPKMNREIDWKKFCSDPFYDKEGGDGMNELRQAAEMALKALEDIFGKEKVDVGAINALRQALAEPEDPRIVELRTLMAEPTVTGVIFEVHRGPLSKSIREFGDCPCPTHAEGDVRIEVKE